MGHIKPPAEASGERTASLSVNPLTRYTKSFVQEGSKLAKRGPLLQAKSANTSANTQYAVTRHGDISQSMKTSGREQSRQPLPQPASVTAVAEAPRGHQVRAARTTTRTTRVQYCHVAVRQLDTLTNPNMTRWGICSSNLACGGAMPLLDSLKCTANYVPPKQIVLAPLPGSFESCKPTSSSSPHGGSFLCPDTKGRFSQGWGQARSQLPLTRSAFRPG